MTDRESVIHEIVVMIARAADRERAMADHLEEGIRLLTESWLWAKPWDELYAWIAQAQVLAEASRLAHRPEPQKAPPAVQDAPGTAIPAQTSLSPP